MKDVLRLACEILHELRGRTGAEEAQALAGEQREAVGATLFHRRAAQAEEKAALPGEVEGRDARALEHVDQPVADRAPWRPVIASVTTVSLSVAARCCRRV